MNKLLKLLAANKAAQRRFEVVAADDGESVTVYLYDAIVADDMTAEWWGGVSAQSFAKTMAGITAPTVHLRVNSPGGDVFAARAMEQAIRECSATVIAHVDGYAASAASYLVLAADEVEISKGGFFMIHKAWTVCMGNAKDFQDTATLLDKVDESLVTTYADETGQDPDQLREWMTAETWFTADEAVQYGFADRIAESTDKTQAKWDLSAYGKAPGQPAAQARAEDELLNDPVFMERMRARLNMPAPKTQAQPEPPAANTDELKRRLDLAAMSA